MNATVICPNAVRRDAVGNYVVFVARALRELGYRVRVLAQDALDLPLDLAGSGRVVGALADPVRLPPDLQQHLASSVVSFYVYPAWYELVRLLEHRVGGARVFDYHGVTPPGLWRGPGRAALVAGEAGLPVARHADHAITHSQWMARELQDRTGLPAERISALALPIDVERFRSAGEAASGFAASRGAAGPLLLYVGRIASSKRVDVLVAALALLVERGRDARLLLVGDAELAPYRATLERLLTQARRLGVADRLTAAGRVGDDHLPGLYAAADVLVTASEHEGSCVPVAEAMATGCPVVATAAAALPETVGEAGLLVPPGDPSAFAGAILRVLDEPGLRARLVATGHLQVAERAPARQLAALRELLDRLGVPPPEGESTRPDPLVAIDEAARAFSPYRDSTHRSGPLRWLTRLRAALTRHLVRNHLDPLAERALEAQLVLATELRRLRAEQVDQAARQEARAAEIVARLAALEDRIGSLETTASGHPGTAGEQAPGRAGPR